LPGIARYCQVLPGIARYCRVLTGIATSKEKITIIQLFSS
jgi:hypothetical protein